MGAMYLIKSFIAARAQLVTFILFVWAVLAIEKFIETKKKRYALLLILIPLLITNLHCAVFPFYFILFLPYIGEYLLLVLEDADFDYIIENSNLKDLKRVALEMLLSMKRAGADMIITYYALEASKWLKEV